MAFNASLHPDSWSTLPPPPPPPSPHLTSFQEGVGELHAVSVQLDERQQVPRPHRLVQVALPRRRCGGSAPCIAVLNVLGVDVLLPLRPAGRHHITKRRHQLRQLRVTVEHWVGTFIHEYSHVTVWRGLW